MDSDTQNGLLSIIINFQLSTFNTLSVYLIRIKSIVLMVLVLPFSPDSSRDFIIGIYQKSDLYEDFE